MTGRATGSRGEITSWLAPVAVVVITVAAFLPALRDGFVSWDDKQNFLDNPAYRGLGPEQLRWMWTTFHMGHYVPLSWMTLGFDYLASGMNPAGYHLTNVAFHAANAVLVYALARRLLLVAHRDDELADAHSIAVSAAAAALLFSVHPLRVESVAWITERRDVLSLFFYLSTILAYLRSLDEGRRRRAWYVAALAIFVAALLSKGTSVSLPAVLLVLNFYPIKRIGSGNAWLGPDARRVYRELTPFAPLSAGFIVLSIVALHPRPQLTVSGKIAVSAYSLCLYLLKTVLPARLSPLYPMPRHVVPTAAVFLMSYAGVPALAVAIWLVRRRLPSLTAAMLIFAIVTLPMLGVVQNGPQIAADRYTYHASPALAILVASAMLDARWRRMGIRIAAGAAIVVLAALTWNQTLVWRSSSSLWARVLDLHPESDLAHTAYANELMKSQDSIPEALLHYQSAIALVPESPDNENDLGAALANIGRFSEAIEHYRRALQLLPTHAGARDNWARAENNLAIGFAAAGQMTEADPHFREATTLEPMLADAEYNWGYALLSHRRAHDAIPHLQRAVDLRPRDADAHLSLSRALLLEGQVAAAVDELQETLTIDPANAVARQYLDQVRPPPR